MRYQSRTNRSQSYLNQFNKENKENQNILNLKQNKLSKPKHLDSFLPKLQKKISQATTNISLQNPLLKDQDLSVLIKRDYSEQTAQIYSQNIMKHLCDQSTQSTGFLNQHTITSTLRSKMIDWMVQVLSSYKMTQDSFFRSVKVMDNFLKKTKKTQQIKDLHLIGVASMFTACKYEQIYPIKLQTMYDRIARKKFKRCQIIEKESEIITTLDFKLEDVNIYDLIQNANHQIKLDLSECKRKYLNEIVLYLSKMSLFCYDLSQIDTKQLAAAVYFISLKTLQQIQPNLNPEGKLSQIKILFSASQEKILQVSRKVLQLAKNYSKVYPNLSNLKKFNKFQYKKNQ